MDYEKMWKELKEYVLVKCKEETCAVPKHIYGKIEKNIGILEVKHDHRYMCKSTEFSRGYPCNFIKGNKYKISYRDNSIYVTGEDGEETCFDYRTFDWYFSNYYRIYSKNKTNLI